MQYSSESDLEQAAKSGQAEARLGLRVRNASRGRYVQSESRTVEIAAISESCEALQIDSTR